MSGDQLDLDAIEARLRASSLSHQRLGRWPAPLGVQMNLAHTLDDAEALVAEVRRLRSLPDLTLGWDSRQGVLVFTDVSAAERVTLREWIERE